MSSSTRPARSAHSVHEYSRPQPRLQVVKPSTQPLSTSRSVGFGKALRHLILRRGVAVTILGLSLIASLMLHTQMVQDSFQITKLQTSVGVLTQDVQDSQEKLDQLNASLPQKVQSMGMVAQKSPSVTVDLRDVPQQSSSSASTTH